MEFFDGENYYTPHELAEKTSRGVKAIIDLVNYGNQLNILKSRRIVDRILIPESGIREFIWVTSGRYGAMSAYRYDADWNKVPVEGVKVSSRKPRSAKPNA